MKYGVGLSLDQSETFLEETPTLPASLGLKAENLIELQPYLSLVIKGIILVRKKATFSPNKLAGIGHPFHACTAFGVLEHRIMLLGFHSLLHGSLQCCRCCGAEQMMVVRGEGGKQLVSNVSVNVINSAASKAF